MFLLNSRLVLVTAAPRRGRPLYRRYGANLPSSLRRFNSRALEYSSRIPVSVCGTGRLHSKWSAFLGTNFQDAVSTVVSTYPVRTGLSLPLIRPRHIVASGCWNINQLCIDYSLRPRLSSRLTPGGRTLPGKPYPYGDPDSNRVYRYSSPDSHFPKVHRRSRFGFIPAGTLSYRSSIGRTHIFGAMLSPDHLRRRFTRWVSYYALFKWWLPLSQHPHCLCKSTSFST